MSTINGDPNELSLIMTLIAIVLSDDMGADELNAIGNLIITIGTVMVTISAIKAIQELKQDEKQQKDEMQKKFEHVQKQIDQLKAK